MIDEQHPDEDSITHIDLLGRILSLVGRIDGQKGEFISRLEAIQSYLGDIFDDKIKENQLNMDKFDKSLDSKFGDFKKDILNSNQTIADKLTARLEETLGTIEKKFVTLQSDVYGKIDSAQASFSKDSKDGLINSKKELEVIMNNAVSGMVAKINEMRRYLDIRLSNLEQSTLRTAQTEVEKELKEITTRAMDAQLTLETYRKEMSQTFQKYQSETISKMGELTSTFKGLKDKFALISQSLQ